MSAPKSSRDEAQARLNTYRKALDTLRDALQIQTPSLLERDGTLQRFEYVHELTWKTMKAVLAYSGIAELRYPRQIYGKAVTHGLIDSDLPWVAMLEDRNYLSHLYRDDLADEVYGRLPGYLDAFELFYQRALRVFNS